MNVDSDVSREFSVNRTTLGGATVLTPSGSVTFENCAELRTALEQTGDGSRPTAVIDCKQVRAFDSEALELLTEWHHMLSERGGALKLANLNDVCVDILFVTRLVHVLNVCESIGQAVQSG